MEWSGLEGLGVEFIETVRRVYKEPWFLFYAIDCPEVAQGLLQDIFGDMAFWVSKKRRCADCLEMENCKEKTMCTFDLTSLHGKLQSFAASWTSS